MYYPECVGCQYEQPDQMSHMDHPDGCLHTAELCDACQYESLNVVLQDNTLPQHTLPLCQGCRINSIIEEDHKVHKSGCLHDRSECKECKH